jgi:hypothetical protein
MSIYNFQFPKLGKLELLSVWQKGKNSKGLRFLCKNIKDGNCFMLWIDNTDIPFNGCFQVEYSADVLKGNYKKESHIKLGVYNYYLVEVEDLEQVFELEINKWLDSTSLFPENLNSYSHLTKDRINYEPVIFPTRFA